MCLIIIKLYVIIISTKFIKFKYFFFRSHNLLADEIAAAVHSLASVNIGWFFQHFLPTFLSSCEGVDDMQRATLLDNFDKSTVSTI